MVSGLFSAKTVVHLSTAAATASREQALAVSTEVLAVNTSTTHAIARYLCIISSLVLVLNSHHPPNVPARLPSFQALADIRDEFERPSTRRPLTLTPAQLGP